MLSVTLLNFSGGLSIYAIIVMLSTYLYNYYVYYYNLSYNAYSLCIPTIWLFLLLQKRHAAQVTRLQRQATDAQSQRSQYVEEIIRIDQIIQNIKSRIEE